MAFRRNGLLSGGFASGAGIGLFSLTGTGRFFCRHSAVPPMSQCCAGRDKGFCGTDGATDTALIIYGIVQAVSGRFQSTIICNILIESAGVE